MINKKVASLVWICLFIKLVIDDLFWACFYIYMLQYTYEIVVSLIFCNFWAFVFPKFQNAYALHNKVFNLQHTVASATPASALKYLPQNLSTPWTITAAAAVAMAAACPLGIWKGIHLTHCQKNFRTKMFLFRQDILIKYTKIV